MAQALFENIALALGKKDSFKAISIVNLISTTIPLLYFVGLVSYYIWSLTEYESETIHARKVQSGYDIMGALMIYGIIISFPLGQIISVVLSIIWVVYNFKEERKILLIIGISGTVFQFVFGFISIMFGIFLCISTPLTLLFGISVGVLCLFQIWWIFAMVLSFIQNKWTKLQEEQLRIRERNEHVDNEQMADELE